MGNNIKLVEETKTETVTNNYADGSTESRTTESKLTRKISGNEEPDYVKIYTGMWCEFNQIPLNVRPLFLEMVSRMTYADYGNTTEAGGQVVALAGPVAKAIQKRLDIKESMFYRQVKTLVDCGAIRKISRGFYQVNPSYAGRGLWKYNPKKKQGGIENIIATFNFKDKTINQRITYAEDGDQGNIGKWDALTAEEIRMYEASTN